MPYLILEYTLAEDYLQRRTTYRAEHLALLEQAHRSGELVMAGALSDPADRSVLVWTDTDPQAPHRFVSVDPYVANGVVVSWTLRTWNVVVGGASQDGRTSSTR